MTREEAIETLKANYPDACYEQLREAVDAAIEALKAQGVAGDTIYRQTAIDAMYKILHDYFWANDEELDAIIATLNDLPSAQPDAIPLEWIAKHLEWLDNCDNDFAQLAKVAIRAMVEIWKKDKTQ